MKSIIQHEKECFKCGRTDSLEDHHIFPAYNRKHSEKYGLKVWLCHVHHNEPPSGVHHNKEAMLVLCKLGQRAFKKTYPELDFREIFGRNFL